MISEVEGWAELHWKCPRRNMTKKEEAMLKKIENLNKEKQRIEEMCSYEKEYSQYDYICGIDEVGRGPLAGPVVACAVILPKDARILYVNDSKKLSPKKREELYDVIIKDALSVGIGIVDATGKLILKKEKDYDKKQDDMSNIVLNKIIEIIKESEQK